MDSQEALNLINILLKKNNCPLLTETEEIIFRDAWEKVEYGQTSHKIHYSCHYTRYLGWELWQRLSDLFSKPISKHNLHQTLSQCQLASYSPRRKSNQDLTLPPDYQPFPQEDKISEEIIRDQLQVVGIVGMVGTGKSSLAKAVTQKVERNFEAIIWQSFDSRYHSCKEWMRKIISSVSRKKVKSQLTTDQRIEMFMQLVKRRRCLLVFDNLDQLFIPQIFPGEFNHKYWGYQKLIQRLLTEPHESFLMFTSRHSPQFVRKNLFNFPRFKTFSLPGLSAKQANNLLIAWGVPRKPYLLDQFQQQYNRNPWALVEACSYIQKHYDGDFHNFLGDQNLIFPEIQNNLNQEFRRLTSLEEDIMYSLREQVKPLPKTNLSPQHFKVSRTNLNLALDSLEARSLLKLDAGFIFLSPFLQRYLKTRHCKKTGKMKKPALSV